MGDCKVMKVLVTGGAGYVGSHTCLRLLEEGHQVVVLDNLSNSSEKALKRVQEITGRKLRFICGDIRSPADLSVALSSDTDAVIHFAAFKSVAESHRSPLKYYENNVGGAIALLNAMDCVGVKTLVFSSSATVYGVPDRIPVDECAPMRAASPYGRTKQVVEEIIRDWCQADKSLSAVMLRYFNPVGAHSSGRIGEDPCGEPNNLMPYLCQVAVGRRGSLKVFGTDYPTHDGTGVRDYVHVMDLAEAHIKAIAHARGVPGFDAFNIGAGKGYSVMEVVRAFALASGRQIPVVESPRRAGDIAAIWACTKRAEAVLGWRSTSALSDMCEGAWKWQMLNPSGYEG